MKLTLLHFQYRIGKDTDTPSGP